MVLFLALMLITSDTFSVPLNVVLSRLPNVDTKTQTHTQILNKRDLIKQTYYLVECIHDGFKLQLLTLLITANQFWNRMTALVLCGG